MKTFKTHETASCENCGADLNPTYPKEEKRGAYKQTCEKCRSDTTYKLKESAVPVNTVANVKPGPGDIPPGITALQRMQRAAKKVRTLRKKRKRKKEE